MRLKGNQVEKPRLAFILKSCFFFCCCSCCFLLIARFVCVAMFGFETGFLYVVLAAEELRQGWPLTHGNPPASAFRLKARVITPAFLIFEIGSV